LKNFHPGCPEELLEMGLLKSRSLHSERHALGSPECRPMGRECDDCRALWIGAQAAVDALNVVPIARGADDDLPAFGSSLAVKVRSIGPKDYDDRTRLLLGERVGLLKRVGRQVYGEAFAVSGSDCGQVLRAQVLVGIRETSFAPVCLDKLSEHLRVDLVAVSGKIAGDVVPPEFVLR
jgi:hypothetical protein